MEDSDIKQSIENIKRAGREEFRGEVQKAVAQINLGLERLTALAFVDPIVPTKAKTVKAKAPSQRRKRSATIATAEQIATIREYFDGAPGIVLQVKQIRKHLKELGTSIGQTTIAAACKTLKERLAIEPVGRKGYRLFQANREQQVNGEGQESSAQSD